MAAAATPDLERFVRRLPKAELHLHIEGTLEPEMLFALAKKHGVRLRFDSVEAVHRARHSGAGGARRHRQRPAQRRARAWHHFRAHRVLPAAPERGRCAAYA